MGRDRYVDFLRAWAIVLVVLGHWLITGLVRESDGRITAPELLATVPWTQWLTLGFQIMPLFFLAGGHAAGGSWSRARAAGGSATGWVGQRALRLLLPTGAYSGLVLLAVGICAAVGVDPGTLALVGWAMAMQLAQVGVCLLVARAVRRLLDREWVWRLVQPVGGASMTLYLWHMLPVLVVAAAFYLTALAPEPAFGSAGWWALRVPWLLVLGLVLAGFVAALRPLERKLAALYERTRPDADRRRSWMPWLGLAASVAALSRFAVRGFAYDGRFPFLPSLGLALGIGLLLLPGRTSPDHPAQREDALEEAA
ncbi:acyltransferase family protein [Streptomyces sp. NPDC001212]